MVDGVSAVDRVTKIDALSRVRACPRFSIMQPENLTLAPASGSGIGKILADTLLADPDFVPAMVAAAKGGLKAERSYYDKGAGAVVTEPDERVRIQTLALLLAHMEGEPIKRIIHQHLGGTGSVDPLAALQESPALREAAARMLEKAEWRTSGNKAHKRPKPAKIVDAEPTNQGPAGAF